MNCPYCLNPLIHIFPHDYFAQCQYCPGEPYITFTVNFTPFSLELKFHLNNYTYNLKYEIFPQQLLIYSIKPLSPFGPPKYLSICTIENYNNKSPRQIQQDFKRIMKMKAFL